MESFDAFKARILACKTCDAVLPLGAKPIIQLALRAKIIIIGQAPGLKAHQSGIAWNDLSGEQLRKWLNVSKEDFYNPDLFALIPMGFCYPGKSKTGDLPPRKECAPQWHQTIFEHLKEVKLIILIGGYSQKYYLKNKTSLTENVANYAAYLPQYFPLPHPSPRNFIWMNKNPWFNVEVLPVLAKQVHAILNS